MLHQIFTIHDITAEVHTQPFYGINDAVAVRSCVNLVQNPGTTFYDNPEDFRLYHIGSFDDESCVFVQTEKRFIVRLSDLLVRQFPNDENEEAQQENEEVNP